MVSIQGKVFGVLGTDCLQIIPKDGNVEENIFMASLNVPRLARKDESKSERFAFEAREWLRMLTVGQNVVCEVVNDAGGRKYCDIVLCGGTFPNYSINEAFVREGLATVHKGAAKQTNTYFQRILKAEEEAREAGRCLHSLDAKEEHGEIRNIYNQPEVTEEFLESNKGISLPAVLEGVQSPTLFRLMFPSKKRDRPHLMLQCNLMGTSSNTEPFPELKPVQEEAKKWIESNFHQRDVRFTPLAINRANGQLSGILSISKDVTLNYELVHKGWVQIVENVIRDESKLLLLHDAQQKAKDERNGIYEEYSSSEQNVIAAFDASLIEVINGECLVVSEHDAENPVELGKIHRIYLSSIRAPRMGSNAREADALADEAKSRLNELCQNQRLKVRIEFLKETPEALRKANFNGPGGIGDQMNCGSVFVNGKNVALDLLSKGLVTVPYYSPNASNEKGFDHHLYLKKESEAKVANVGRHQPNLLSSAPLRMADLTGKDASLSKSKQYETILQRAKRLEGTVTFVYNPGRFKVSFPQEKIIANVVISNLTVSQGPRTAYRNNPATEGDPCNEEALLFTKANMLNKTVKFEILQSDRAGNFLAQAYLGNEKFGDILLKKGFAIIAMEHRADQRQLTLQDEASNNNLGMWANETWRESKLAVHEAVVEEVIQTDVPVIQLPSVSVVHVNTVTDFFLIEDTEEADIAQSSLQNKIQAFATTSKPLNTYEPQLNRHCLAEFSGDNSWYRGKIQKIDRKNRMALVLFIDFGNSEDVKFEKLMGIPPQFDIKTTPPFAQQYSMVGMKDKGEYSLAAATNLFELTQDPPYQATVYATKVPSIVIRKKAGTKSINAEILELGNAIISKSRMPSNLDETTKNELEKASSYANSMNQGIYKFFKGTMNSDDSDF